MVATHAFSGYAAPARTAMSVQVTQSKPDDQLGMLRADAPPSLTACTAPSMKGAAVPYGSRSMTSKRVRSVRWLYMTVLRVSDELPDFDARRIGLGHADLALARLLTRRWIWRRQAVKGDVGTNALDRRMAQIIREDPAASSDLSQGEGRT